MHRLCQRVLSLIIIIHHLATVLFFQLFLLNLSSAQLHMNRACECLVLNIVFLRVHQELRSIFVKAIVNFDVRVLRGLSKSGPAILVI